MGVTYLQHRIKTGLHTNSSKPVKVLKINDQLVRLIPNKDELVKILAGVICVFYIYLVLMLMAGAIETACDVSSTKFHRTYNPDTQ